MCIVITPNSYYFQPFSLYICLSLRNSFGSGIFPLWQFAESSMSCHLCSLCHSILVLFPNDTNFSNSVLSASGINMQFELLSWSFIKTLRRADLNSSSWRASVPAWQLCSEPVIYSHLAAFSFSLITSIWKFTIIFPGQFHVLLIRSSRTDLKSEFTKDSKRTNNSKRTKWTTELNKAQCISDTGQEGHLNQFNFIWIVSLAIQPEFILSNKSCE